MPRIQLTDRFCQHARPDATGRTDYFDAATKGLALRCSAAQKSWTFHFTSPKDQRRARVTLGSYPAISLAAARTAAIEARTLLEGSPPRDPRDVLAADDTGAMTVATLIPLYIDKPNRRTGKPRKTVKEIKRRFDVNVVPIIGSVKLADLHRRDMTRVTAPILKRQRPIEAARVFEDVRAMVRWAVGQGYLDVNVFDAMEPPARGSARERVLTDDEVKALWNGLPKALARSKSCQRILKLCLVTAQRVGEVAGMRPDEIDFDSATWTIPAARSKNGHEHTVPLSPLAVAIIREAIADASAGVEFVFPEGDGALPAAAVARTVLRAHEADENRPNGRFGIAHWTAHDLRRTAVSNMAALGVAPIVLGHVINHRSVTKAGVTLAVYSQYGYGKEKRAALDLWADRLLAIVGAPGSAQILPLRA